jgi:hypothetical protein
MPEVDFRAVVRAPAICLIGIASLALLMDIPMAFVSYMDATHVAQGNDYATVAGPVGGAVGLILMHVIVLIGAVNMLKLSSYQFARAAAIIAVVPLCTPLCVVGIPFGIWAIVVLSRAGVEEAFE